MLRNVRNKKFDIFLIFLGHVWVGCDVSRDMFFHGGEDCASSLPAFFNQILETGQIPDKWCETHFILLNKEGCTSDVNNWRPIAILAASYKVLARIIYERLQPVLDSAQSDEQFGFRRKRSTASALLILEHIIEKSLEWQTDCWIVSSY